MGDLTLLTETKRARLKAQAVECIQAGRTIVSTAGEIGVTRETLYNWRLVDPEFARVWDAAYTARVDHLEDVAFQRATEGSDQLLMFLLKGGRSERYGDKRQLDVRNHTDIDVRVLRSLPVDELLARLTALRDAQRDLEIEGNVIDLDEQRQVTVKTE
jgi:hypothetical protein